jgi:hypothetical protein
LRCSERKRERTRQGEGDVAEPVDHRLERILEQTSKQSETEERVERENERE